MLQYPFMQRAIIGGILAASVCSAIGVFLVLRRMSLIGDGLAHLSFGGIAAGLFFKIYPLFSALVVSVLAALGIHKLRKMKIYGDSSIAIFFSFGLAVGVILIGLSGGMAINIMSFLFGSILAISDADLLLIFALALITAAAIGMFYKELVYVTFDEECARVSGIHVDRLELALLILTALAVVLSIQIVGILLVSSFIAIPAATALPISRSFKQALALSVALSVFSVVFGLSLSYYFNLAAGGAIVLVLVAAFFAMLFFKNIQKQRSLPKSSD